MPRSRSKAALSAKPLPYPPRRATAPTVASGPPARHHRARARKAAVLTRFWHAVEQKRRVPLREVST
jgi:hypothetical protein